MPIFAMPISMGPWRSTVPSLGFLAVLLQRLPEGFHGQFDAMVLLLGDVFQKAENLIVL
jgi:hypothetical protein